MPDLPTPFEQLTAALAGAYRLGDKLGEGGMATVYLAHDLRHNRQVALKVLKPELTAALGAQRFLQEIQVTANLQHPHILPLYDSGNADGGLSDDGVARTRCHVRFSSFGAEIHGTDEEAELRRMNRSQALDEAQSLKDIAVKRPDVLCRASAGVLSA